jgi:hypothetical protein
LQRRDDIMVNLYRMRQLIRQTVKEVLNKICVLV